MATSKGKRKRDVEAPRLPDDAWRRILGDLPADYPLHSVAMVSKQLLRIAREMEGAAQTDLGPLLSMTSVTFSASFLDWLHLCVCGRDDLDEGVQEAVAILAARSPGGLDVLQHPVLDARGTAPPPLSSRAPAPPRSPPASAGAPP